MVIENDPSARMQLRSLGELVHPGTCMVCGNGNCEDGYIDLGVFFDYEGTMYLCKKCCYQAGETFGMFTPEEVRQTQDLAEKLAQANETLTQELKDARSYAANLNDVLHSSLLTGATVGGAVSASAQQGDGASVKPFSGADDGESEFEESVTVPRSSDSGGATARNFTFG